MSEVVIQNPLPGGGNRTSRKRANSFVRRGVSVYAPTGELLFLDQGKRIAEQHGREAGVQGGRKLYAWSGARKGNRFSERDSTPGISRS